VAVDDAERQAVVDRILADPPAAHVIPDRGGESLGVWATEDSCYRLLAQVVTPESRTLETGCGLSTALFAALGAHHTCVTPSAEEPERLRRYLRERGIADDRVVFCIDSSHTALPKFDSSSLLDVAFIDGDHGFPLPVVDWFYAGGRLCRGGKLIIDDIQLAAVALLVHVLDSDVGWEPLERTAKWAAFRRLSSGPLNGGPWDQPSAYATHHPRRRSVRGRISRVVKDPSRVLHRPG
jgi:hypothetical protein